MEKKTKLKLFITLVIVCLIVIILYFILKYSIKGEETDNNNNIETVNNNSVGINNLYEELDSIENNIISSQNINNIIVEQSEVESYWNNYSEVEAYWNNYKDPNHWSENTKMYTLAYALKEDKYDTQEDYITQTNEIIAANLPTNSNGIFISSSSRTNITNTLKAEGFNIFYIDDCGMLKYKISENRLETPLEDFLISIIDSSEKLYIIDISFAYIDEDNGTNPLTMPIEINYLGFNINDNQELFVYNMYNFNFEVFIEGLQELTNRKIET